MPPLSVPCGPQGQTAPGRIAGYLRRRAGKLWRRMSLAQSFLCAAALVLVASMAVLGSWVSHRITASVLDTTGTATAAFLQTVVGPEIQMLGDDGVLPLEGRRRLDAVLHQASAHRGVISLKIWGTDGVLIYSSADPGSEGRRFGTDEVAHAAMGQIVARFDEIEAPESAGERSLGLTLIEVYAPLFRDGSDQVIAVGEAYENSETLAQQLRDSRRNTWIVVCLTTLVMLSVLYLIVQQGSDTISRQRRALQDQVAALERLAGQNEALHRRAEQSRLDANDANEALLGRIGQELHDGPIQILTLVMLRLSQFFSGQSSPGARRIDQMHTLLDLTGSSIQELRILSVGLVLPEIDHLDAIAAVRLAVERHERLTSTRVGLDLDGVEGEVPGTLKVCLYRIVQEGLSNAYRHTGGAPQSVTLRSERDWLCVAVRDEGQGMAASSASALSGSGLGLRGIRNRAQAFGGTVDILTGPGGTEVRVRFPLA